MAKANVNWLLVAGIVVLGYFLVAGVPWGAQPSAPAAPAQGSVAGCNVEDISFTPKMVRMGKVGTDLSTAANNYFITTDNLGSVAGNAATTVPTDYRLQVLFGENSTEYYTVVQSVDTGCQDPKFVSVALPLADASLNSLYAKNSDGSVNSASNAEPMGADDTFETTVALKAGSDTYFGNPTSSCENIAVIEYDKTYIKQASGDDAAPVPGSFTYTNSSYDGSQAFVIPKSADGEEVSFNVALESTGTEPDGTNNPILHVYDCDIDKDEDTLALIHGVEDEDLNSISLAAQSLVLRLS